MNCSIGDMEQSTLCHKTTYTNGHTSLLSIAELSEKEIQLIVWRTGIKVDQFNTICLHHKMIYINKFVFLHPFCEDPFRRHVEKKRIKGESVLFIRLKIEFK